MDAKVMIDQVAAIEAELADLDRGIERLQTRRALLEAYAGSMRALHADLAAEGRGEAALPGRPAVPPPVTRWSEFESATARTNARSERRAFMLEVVKEAVRIIAEHPDDRPLSAVEIHALHSRRGALTPKQLYVTLYKRAAQGKYLRMVNGLFWPWDASPPEGWDGNPKGHGTVPR